MIFIIYLFSLSIQLFTGTINMNEFHTSCHCLSVQCSFILPITTVLQCHCANCRRLQGSDYSTWLAICSSQFSILLGKELIITYEANERSSRSFCRLRGTTVYAKNGKHFDRHRMLPLGTVKNHSHTLNPQVQVYTEHKAPWIVLDDRIPVLTN